VNLVDSCGWLEFLGNGPNASDYEKVLTDPSGPENLILPSICLQEVFKIALPLEAAHLGQEHGLALADGIVFATAKLNGATLWTQDAAFKGLPKVHFVVKKKSA
jgi:toxin FitB